MKIYNYTNVVEKSQNDFENQFNFIVDKLEKYMDMDIEDDVHLLEIIKILDICDEFLITHVLDNFYVFDNNVKISCQKYIDNLLVKLLNKTYYYEDKEIGYVLLENYMNDYKILGYSLLLFDFYSVAQKYDLKEVNPKIQLMKEEYDYVGLAVYKENLAYINIDTSVSDCRDDEDYKMNVDCLNKRYLETIRHEIRHFIQERKINEKKYENKLEELYCRFQEKLMEIDRHYIDGTYDLGHDYFPHEYDADEFALNELFDLFEEKIFVDHYIFWGDSLDADIRELVTFQNLEPIGDKCRILYHEDNYCGYGNSLVYPNCNLLPMMYEVIEYLTNKIRCCVENGENVDNFLAYKIFELIKIVQEILKFFPDYEEKYVKLMHNLSLRDIEPAFLDFNYENVLKGKLNVKSIFLNSFVGQKYMRRYGYYNKPIKDIVKEFDLDLLFQGYTSEQIEDLYKKCYEEYKDALDFMYFMNFITKQTRFRIQKQKFKEKVLSL